MSTDHTCVMVGVISMKCSTPLSGDVYGTIQTEEPVKGLVMTADEGKLLEQNLFTWSALSLNFYEGQLDTTASGDVTLCGNCNVARGSDGHNDGWGCSPADIAIYRL